MPVAAGSHIGKPAPAANLVQRIGVAIQYNGFQGLAGSDLARAPGHACALIGAKGAGKSTVLKLLAGLEADTANASPAWKREIGLMPGHQTLFDALTIEVHLILNEDLYGLSRQETNSCAEELLVLLDPADDRDRFAAMRSNGMRKKTAIAMAMLHAPKLVLLAPAFGVTQRWPHMLGAEKFAEWERTGELEVFHFGDKALRKVGWQLARDAAHWDAVPRFPQPALIFHGTNDPVVPVASSETYAATHGNVTLHTFDAGHELTEVLDEMWELTARFLQIG